MYCCHTDHSKKKLQAGIKLYKIVCTVQCHVNATTLIACRLFHIVCNASMQTMNHRTHDAKPNVIMNERTVVLGNIKRISARHGTWKTSSGCMTLYRTSWTVITFTITLTPIFMNAYWSWRRSSRLGWSSCRLSNQKRHPHMR